MSKKLNRTSERITQPKSQGASQAMLHATGLSEADLDKAQVGIASCWFEGNPCNMHLLELGAKVKRGVSPKATVSSGAPRASNTLRVLNLPVTLRVCVLPTVANPPPARGKIRSKRSNSVAK